MDTIKFEHKNTLVVAHRGLSGIERENTAAAFVAAGNRSYWGVETDMHRTADGKFIIVHNATLQEVAGENIPVEEVNLATSQSVLLFDKTGGKSRTDLRTPSLEDYINICKTYQKHCVLELKSSFTDEETAAYIQIIKDLDYIDHVTFIAFDYENLVKIRKILPEQPVQFLFTKFTDEIIENVIRDKMDIDVYFYALTKELVDRLHAAGVKVNCWTVDQKDVADRLVEWGVDYITTNILE